VFPNAALIGLVDEKILAVCCGAEEVPALLAPNREPENALGAMLFSLQVVEREQKKCY
jgi:hypothetical protein